MPLFAKIVLVLIVLGALVRVAKMTQVLLKRNRTRKYMQRFLDFCADNTSASQSDAFTWLAEQAGNMQQEMKRSGAIETQPVAVGDVYLPRQVSLPEALAEIAANTDSQQVAQVRETLVRYTSILSEQVSKQLRSVLNPLNWYGTGVKTLLLSPLYLLHGLGIMENHGTQPAKKSRFPGFVASLIAIGLLFLAIASLVWGESTVTDRLFSIWNQVLRIFPG